MSRLDSRPFAVVAAIAALLTLAITLTTFTGSSSADAQSNEPARLIVGDVVAPGPGPIEVTVELDPGSSMLGAITAYLTYDPAIVSVISCEAGINSLCNDLDDRVAFANLSASGMVETADLVTVTFERLANVESMPLGLDVKTAVDVIGQNLDQLELHEGTLSLVEATGSLTGELVSPAGEGLFGIDVCVASDQVSQICQLSSGLGTFRFDDLIAGTYTITAVDPTGERASAAAEATVASSDVATGIILTMETAPVDVPATPDQPEAEATPEPRDIVAGAPGSISGRVLGPDGGAVFGVQVCAEQPLLGNAVCGYTSVSGDFSLADLMVGNYSMSVTDPAARFVSAGDAVWVGVNADAGAANVDLFVAAS